MSTISCKQLLISTSIKNVGAFNIEGQRLFATDVVQTSPVFCCLQLQDINLGRGESDIAKKKQFSDIYANVYKKKNYLSS